jgi:proline iminopeptidase
MAGIAALASNAWADDETYPIAGSPGRRINIRGKALYVEDIGPRHAPALVYVHGGPGAGSWDFALTQRARLSRHVRLVIVDQRGAMRSEAVAEDEPFTLQDLVDDFETLREELGIRRWSMISHSFGGLIATRYALQHPHRVNKLIFENPSFDIAASDRAMLEMLARGYDAANMPEPAAQARAAAAQTMSPREIWRTFAQMGRSLGVQRRLDLYAPSLPPGYFFEWIRTSGLSQDLWAKGSGPSQGTLWQDDACFENLMPRLHELRVPALLLKGRQDFNTGEDQLAAFADVRRGRIVWFEHSGHMIHNEEPDRYAQVVDRFVRTGRV